MCGHALRLLNVTKGILHANRSTHLANQPHYRGGRGALNFPILFYLL